MQRRRRRRRRRRPVSPGGPARQFGVAAAATAAIELVQPRQGHTNGAHFFALSNQSGGPNADHQKVRSPHSSELFSLPSRPNNKTQHNLAN